MIAHRPAVLLVLFACDPLVAQSVVPPQENVVIHLDRSYIMNTIPFRDLVFEGQFAPALFFYQNIPQQLARVFTPEHREHAAWAFSFSPMVRLRMHAEPSNPVRTPSYMPKFTIQYLRVMRTQAGSDEVSRLRSPVRFIELQIIPWGHHSNGQEGCLFEDQTRVDGECADGSFVPDGRAVNIEDGSFSTNYARATIIYEINRLDDNLIVRSAFAASLALEVHPRDFGPGAISQQLQEAYGTYRSRAALEHRRAFAHSWPGLLRPFSSGQFRVEASTEYMYEGPDEVPPFVIDLRVEATFAPLGGWGIAARYYHGQDYYNLGFLRTLNEFQLGVVFDFGRFAELSLSSR
jgi:hypothetical protein